ncbi:putative RNA-directed DNA polymerase from transposon BS [Fusarium oxysporum f. sp. albedinis]|nr:putative RNA-directed DNA polymerase from transposon BS [Fusarium oxysporum f. sp. albedinis]
MSVVLGNSFRLISSHCFLITVSFGTQPPRRSFQCSRRQSLIFALKMPRVSYTEDEVAEAMLDVTDNGLSQNKSAQKREIPRSTLGDR